MISRLVQSTTKKYADLQLRSEPKNLQIRALQTYKKPACPPLAIYLTASLHCLFENVLNVPGKKEEKRMASVAAGISCMGPLGGNQGYQPYPSGPSKLSTFSP